MPAKSASNTRKGKNPAIKAKAKKAFPPDGWEWAPFTKKAVEFNHAARDLSNALKLDFGDNVSISQFEKFVAAVPSMTPAQRGLIYVDPEHLTLLERYRAARATRDSERDNFRGDVKVGDVDTGLAALRFIAINECDEDEKAEEEEEG